MWIFIAMFAVPEILWGGLIKIFKISFLPIYKDIQYFSDNPGVALLLIVIEIIGISGVIYLINKKCPAINLKLKIVINIILIIILVMLVLSLFLSYGVGQINF